MGDDCLDKPGNQLRFARKHSTEKTSIARTIEVQFQRAVELVHLLLHQVT